MFFEGLVGYNPLDVPCTQLMAVINYSNAALPLAVTAFPALQYLAVTHVPQGHIC